MHGSQGRGYNLAAVGACLHGVNGVAELQYPAVAQPAQKPPGFFEHDTLPTFCAKTGAEDLDVAGKFCSRELLTLSRFAFPARQANA